VEEEEEDLLLIFELCVLDMAFLRLGWWERDIPVLSD